MKRVVLLLVFLLGASSVAAQDPPAPAGNPQNNPTATTDGSEQLPPSPVGFFRGEYKGSSGFYLSLWKFGIVLGLFVMWCHTSYWVHDDSLVLKVNHDMWSPVTLATGMVGFISVFTIPAYLGGLGVLVLTYLVPLGFYIAERNSRVPESGKVLTREHFRKILARWGFHIRGRDREVAPAGPSIKFVGKAGGHRGDDIARAKQVENSPGYLAAKELIYDACLRRATDIHLEPKDEDVIVRIRIDGVMYPADPFDSRSGRAIINIFKVLGGMDITERRRPQDGSFRAVIEGVDGRDIDFRAATQGTRHGEKLSLRILDQATAIGKLAGLGLRKQLMDQINDVIHQPHGMFLSCGPTGAGKSTTLYAAINGIEADLKNVITVEDPIEYKMAGVNQIEINTKAGQTFATSLRSILRQDPDVVMVGEIRDDETAKIACQAANTGHMVFSTIHANDTITALFRFLELELEPFMVANSITAILGQRLARRLCGECKVAYRPTSAQLKEAGLPPGKVDKFYRQPKPEERDAPCGGCNGIGYKGRIGVFELLHINDRIREMIRDKTGMAEIRSEARKNGMLYMKEEGLRLVVRGVTSYEELMRVVK